MSTSCEIAAHAALATTDLEHVEIGTERQGFDKSGQALRKLA